MSKILFTEIGFEDYTYFQTQDRKTLKKINKLLKDIERNGADRGIGKVEALKHNLEGYYSRRIDDKNRLVYRVVDDMIEVIQCRGHY